MAFRQSFRCLRLLRPIVGQVSGLRVPVKPIISQTPAHCVAPTSTMGIHTTQPRMNASVVNIQDLDHYNSQVKESKVPVIVDFHASWCGPCKILGPRLETLVAAKEGSVILAKVDIDELSDLAIEHGVQAVPTVLAMKDGKVHDRFVGLKDDDHLTSFINKLTGE